MTNVHCTPTIGDIELPTTMRAVTQDRYGSSGVLSLTELPVPTGDPDRVVVKVERAALNPLDWHMMTGQPWVLRLAEGLRRPKQPVRGVDMSGVVVAVGDNVSGFAPGDEVFGGGAGSFADYVACKPANLAPIPAGMTFGDAAALPVAAVTALQGLRDHGGVTAGTSVLVNGAAGGVGTYAVQIAKHLGADVTAVCSTHNVEMVRELGADTVVDYTTDDVLDLDRRFDVILDNVGNRSLRDVRRLLVDEGVVVMVSGPKKNRLLGPIARVVRAKLRFLVGRRRAVTFVAEETQAELQELTRMVDAGVLRSVVERTYPLVEFGDAMAHLATGHARAKLLLDVSGSGA